VRGYAIGNPLAELRITLQAKRVLVHRNETPFTPEGRMKIGAYAVAVYSMLRDVPWLSVVAVSEGFFVFAYNLQCFGGRFHTKSLFGYLYIMVADGHGGPLRKISRTTYNE
jgi:hypothetical protein